MNVFYQVDCEGEASPLAHFSSTQFYPLIVDGRMSDRNMSHKIIINEHIVIRCSVFLAEIATD